MNDLYDLKRRCVIFEILIEADGGVVERPVSGVGEKSLRLYL